MFRILIDTCVWLDLAKDYQQQALLSALEELIRQRKIALILPRTVLDEFARNKARIIEESSRSLSGTMKRVKEAVEKFGDPKQKNKSSARAEQCRSSHPHSWQRGCRHSGAHRKAFCADAGCRDYGCRKTPRRRRRSTNVRL